MVEVDSGNANAYFNRGCCYDSLGELDKAISDYSHALELDNKNQGDLPALDTKKMLEDDSIILHNTIEMRENGRQEFCNQQKNKYWQYQQQQKQQKQNTNNYNYTNTNTNTGAQMNSAGKSKNLNLNVSAHKNNRAFNQIINQKYNQ